MANGTSQNDAEIRGRLGQYLVFGSAGAVVALSIAIVGMAWWKDAKEGQAASQLILTAVLPLLGTWVGTVLAFYYSKDNYEAASRGTLAAIRSAQGLSSTPLQGNMTPRSAIVTVRVPAGKKLGDVALKDVDTEINKPGANGKKVTRLVIVDEKDACVGILHRSTWMEMLYQGFTQTPPLAIDTGTLGAVLSRKYDDSTTFEDVITKTVAFVAADKTVADAKASMESVPRCQDVIVTAAGKSIDSVVGWITNADIARLSQA
jgi:CBS domain-containing protein